MNRTMEGAKRKGYIAGLQGKQKEDCPYSDWRTNYHEGVTFSRAYIRIWEEGRQIGEEEARKFRGHSRWSEVCEHRCVLCGYTSDTTNVCRHCPETPLEPSTMSLWCEKHKKFHFDRDKKPLVHGSVLMRVED